jgi:hypothetical protein
LAIAGLLFLRAQGGAHFLDGGAKSVTGGVGQLLQFLLSREGLVELFGEP